MDEGGEIAQRLDALYSFVNQRILQAAQENSVAPARRRDARARDACARAGSASSTTPAETGVRGAA